MWNVARVFAPLLLIIVTLGCARAGRPSVPTAAASSAPASEVDVRLSPLNRDQVVTVAVGQTIGLASPGGEMQWTVSYNDRALLLVHPTGDSPTVGPEGWVWKAMSPAQVELVVNGVHPPCAVRPCPAPPPNPPRFVYRLDVR